MIEKFVTHRGIGLNAFLDLNQARSPMILLSLAILKFARDPSIQVWRTSESGHQAP